MICLEHLVPLYKDSAGHLSCPVCLYHEKIAEQRYKRNAYIKPSADDSIVTYKYFITVKKASKNET